MIGNISNPYDIIVCGGGMAGCGAAIAAARSGASTLLIEQTEVLGGLGSNGGVGGFAAGQGGHVGQGRVFADILSRLRTYGALGEEHGWCIRPNLRWACENWLFDHQMLPVVLQEICVEAGVNLLLGTTIIDAKMSGGRIEGAKIHNHSLQRIVRASVYIDATGDGILARHAGATTLPDDPNFPGVIRPSFMVYLRKTSQATLQPLPGKRHFEADETPSYSVWWERRGRVGLKFKMFHMDFDTGTGEGFNACVMKMRERIPEFVRHFQESHDASYVFDYASPMMGIREGRRIAGDTVLTIEDIRSERKRADAVAYGTFSIDANGTREKLPPYHIPYGSLIPRGIENGLMAGRCFSADRLALSSARVMPTCCMMGNAAGLAAAQSAKDGIPVREINPQRIRDALIAEDPEGNLIRKRMDE